MDHMNLVSIDAAFGMNPGATVLPVPRDPVDSWHRAVALGAQGYYAAARAGLARTRRMDLCTPELVSLSLSTEGSLWRQLGWYDRASHCDGAALAAATQTGESTADALTGLAADALGAGRLALSRRLLERVHPEGWRQEIRLRWVSAEWAMASGLGEQALRYADEAVSLSAVGPSMRHRVKSALLRAAALTCVHARDEAMSEAEKVSAACAANGLVPLQWAAAMLRGESDEARRCAVVIARRGGYFR